MMKLLLSTFFAYLPYALVAAFTPGPNNILTMHAIARDGWHKGRRIIFGIGTGFLCVMAVCGLFCWSLAQFLPGISQALTYLGAVYILWLAWHVANSRPEDGGAQSAGFFKGMALQFVNVKIYMYGITVFSAYVLPASRSPLFAAVNALLLTLLGAAGFTTWGLAGELLQNFIKAHFRAFNLVMAAILALCALDLLF